MLIDMHIHTSRYSLCSVLEPEDIVSRAESMGLDGIIITEHDYVWSEGEVESLKKGTGTDLLIMRAQEVSSVDGHILVYGCNGRLDHMETRDMLGIIHAAGGVAVPSHPFRFGDYPMDMAGAVPGLAVYDAFEALNGNQDEEQNAFGLALWKGSGLVGTGGSDAHSGEMVGRFATEFDNPVFNMDDLINEIKAGRCRPFICKEET